MRETNGQRLRGWGWGWEHSDSGIKKGKKHSETSHFLKSEIRAEIQEALKPTLDSKLTK